MGCDSWTPRITLNREGDVVGLTGLPDPAKFRFIATDEPESMEDRLRWHLRWHAETNEPYIKHQPWDFCGDSMIAMVANAGHALTLFSVYLRITPAEMWDIINSCPDPQVRLFMAVMSVQLDKEMLDEPGFTEYCLNNQGMILG